MFAIGFVWVCIQRFGIEGGPIYLESVAGALGAAIGNMIFPALVIIPWRLAQQKRRTTDTPVQVGFVVFSIIMAISIVASMA